MAKSEYEEWWFCENILNHQGQIALLRMDFPRVFILVRSYEDAYPCAFEEFCDDIAEVNFLNPEDRKTADISEILVGAWNFLALTEREEERLYEENNEYME